MEKIEAKINTTRAFIGIIILLTLGVSSCVGAEQLFPTVTPTPNLTIEPTMTTFPTPTDKPTNTPTPEPTVEPTPTPTQPEGPIATARKPLRLGQVEIIEEGGFSFQGILGYEESYQRTQVTLVSEDGDTVISLIGVQSNPIQSLETELDHFIEIIARNEIILNTESSYQGMVDGRVGLVAMVSGDWGETQVTGRILVVSPAEERLFYALAISPDTDTGRGWEPQGRQAFEAIINSITFHEPSKPEGQSPN